MAKKVETPTLSKALSAYQRRYGNSPRREMVSSAPIAAHVHVGARETEVDRIRRLIKSEQMTLAALQSGHETFEEADDFDIPEDPIEPTTPYEEVFEPEVTDTDRVLAALEKLSDGDLSEPATKVAKAPRKPPRARSTAQQTKVQSAASDEPEDVSRRLPRNLRKMDTQRLQELQADIEAYLDQLDERA